MKIRDFSRALIPEFGGSDQELDDLTTLDSWVIGTINNIANSWEWECLRVTEPLDTEASKAEYQPITPSVDIYDIRIPADDLTIHQESVDRLNYWNYDLEQEGSTQTYWYPSGFDTATKQSKFKLYQVPTTVRTLEINAKKRTGRDDLDADSESPFPANFEECILDGTRIMIAFHRLKNAQAKAFDVLYKEKLHELQGRKPSINKRLRRGVSDIQRRSPVGPILDPAHYRNE